MLETQLPARLARIGLGPAQWQQCMALQAQGPDAACMRVIEVQREHLVLHDGETSQLARPLPALCKLLELNEDGLAVGDWVLAQRNTWGEWWVSQRLTPSNQLARRLHDGRDKVERVVIVSNVDTAVLTMGLDLDFNLARLQRYLALVRMAGVGAVVALTKRDLVAASVAEARLQSVLERLPPDVGAVALDATGEEPRQMLAPWLHAAQTLVLLGSSGAGKSTLTNALTQSSAQDTGGTRRADGRGRHTTTVRSLHLTPEGACIIDTPGLRTLRLDGDAEQLDAVFTDVAALAQTCRFRDCRHAGEPGCAVREGVSAERLRSYQKLQREARRDSLSALERKAQQATWKVRAKAARVRDRRDQ